MEFEGQARINNQLNIAPLVDVVFLLLIFFMLTSTMITQQGIELSLPGAQSTTAIDQTPLEISINSEGVVFIGDQVIAISELSSELLSLLSDERSEQIVLRADSRVSVDKLVEVMDLIRTTGATNIALATERRS